MTIELPGGVPSRVRLDSSARPAPKRADTAPARPEPAPAQAPVEAAPPPRVEPRTPMSLGELAQALRKVNLTFDLFEIQAQIAVTESGDITITVVNQRTGEMIRRIPPEDFHQFLAQVPQTTGRVTDLSV